MILPPLVIEHPHGRVMVTFETFEENGEQIAGIYDFRGKINLPPKAWLSVVRTTLREIEQRLKAQGFAELRLRGRDWRLVLPDYEPNPAFVNGLKKRL